MAFLINTKVATTDSMGNKIIGKIVDITKYKGSLVEHYAAKGWLMMIVGRPDGGSFFHYTDPSKCTKVTKKDYA